MNVKYTIRPCYKPICFGIFGERRVYKLLKTQKEQKWIDSSCDNGTGKFMVFRKTVKIKTFDTFDQANEFKKEMDL